jgi:Na+/melibiose symporter-like transporter
LSAEKLTRSFKLAYGTGQFALGIMGNAMAIFLLFYYNQVLGLSSGLAGLAIGLALVVDAISDPLVGSISDNWRSRYGRRHPFLYASILPAAISFFLLFNPLVTSDLGLVIWLVIFSNATRSAMSLFNVPHISLGAEISDDFDERSELAAYRMFFQYAGGLFVLVVGFYFFFASTPEFQNGQLNAAAYPPFALLLSILIAVSIFLTAWGTRSIVPSLPVPPEGPRVSLVETLFRVIADLRSAVRNRSFRWFVAGNLSIFVIVGVNFTLDLYMFTYFWEFESEDVLLVIIGFPIGLMLGTPFSPRVIGRFDKKAAMILGTLAWGVCQMLPVSLRLMAMRS